MIKKEDGQSLVEFALVIPILLLLLVGIFDFGRIMFSYLELEMVSQETVRKAGLGAGDSEIISYALDANHYSLVDSSRVNVVSISPDEGARDSGDYVTVTLSYPVQFLRVLGDLSIPFTVESSSTIRVE
ncbi:TadE/TadG family type IV pilus assembly protein [Virgibacillus siamensis]|uniref:TadE/TadG family type IV pilus assembly protein n=1 Tax=Virgibacillus siamensis TaxID=480071 RepID=UPI0009876950|nr:TadE/TadG family type IV pilus assembly protein [Virgibacillus siamensis]